MAAARILHLHSSFDLGGKEARCAQLMNHFGGAAEHVILSAAPGAMNARNAVDAGVRVSYPGGDAPSLAGLPALGRYRQIAAYMKKFDLILSYNWGSMDGVMAHALFSRIHHLPPLIHHEDGFNDDEIDGLKTKRNWFRTLALRRSYAVVVPSITLANIARSIWHQPQHRIQQIANGIDTARYLTPAEPGSIPGFIRQPGDVVVGTIAGLRAVKNLPRLVRAVAAAGDDVRLVIAGEGPDRPVIEAEAKRLGISDRVLLPGFLRDPARYVGHFDIFALTSDSEQYPISLVEAMAAGKPVVATDVGDIRNMVSAQNRMYVFPRYDEDALATAIRTFAGDPELRTMLGAANQTQAISQYDEETMFARYRELYGSAMNRADFARQS